MCLEEKLMCRQRDLFIDVDRASLSFRHLSTVGKDDGQLGCVARRTP